MPALTACLSHHLSPLAFGAEDTTPELAWFLDGQLAHSGA
jgi:hypothetical protein